MATAEQVHNLRKELKEVRDASLTATRVGDFMQVARLTAKAARINQEIMNAEGELEADRTGANQRDARRG